MGKWETGRREHGRGGMNELSFYIISESDMDGMSSAGFLMAWLQWVRGGGGLYGIKPLLIHFQQAPGRQRWTAS